MRLMISERRGKRHAFTFCITIEMPVAYKQRFRPLGHATTNFRV